MFIYLQFLWIVWLTAVTGAANAFALLYLDQAVTHQTGALTQVCLQWGQGHWLPAALSVLVSFFLGGLALRACFTRPVDYRLPQFGYLLIALGLGIVILPWTPLLPYTTYILAFIFGMQNALPIQWQGVLVRSTHFTGYLTDLSRLLADRSHRTHQGPAIALYIGSLVSFVGGAALMSTCFYRFELDLASLGWLYTSTGISYLGLCLMAHRYSH